MSEQTTWIPLPKARRKKVKVIDAIERVEQLAFWYAQHRPQVQRIWVTPDDYAAFEAATGTRGISLTVNGIYYRGFRIEATL